MDNLEQTPIETPPEDNSQQTPPEDAVAKRHAEQLAGSKAEVDRIKSIAVDTIASQAEKDSAVFLEVHAKDPKLANEVAKKLGYADANEVLSFINGIKEEKKGFSKEDVERIVAEREAQKEHEKALKTADKILAKLPDNLKEEAQKRFDKITKGQMLDEETAKEFAEMATLYVNKDNLRADVLNDSLSMLGSIGAGSNKKASDKEPQYVVRDGKLVLLSNSK